LDIGVGCSGTDAEFGRRRGTGRGIRTPSRTRNRPTDAEPDAVSVIRYDRDSAVDRIEKVDGSYIG
jgi:hypothetical protein